MFGLDGRGSALDSAKPLLIVRKGLCVVLHISSINAKAGALHNMQVKNIKSPHILNASTNLVGFSLIVLTSVKVLGIGSTTLVDDIAAFAVMVFIASSFYSFLSIRTHQTNRGILYETIADYIFLGGLSLLFITSAILALYSK
jgi:hypothetical protein